VVVPIEHAASAGDGSSRTEATARAPTRRAAANPILVTRFNNSALSKSKLHETLERSGTTDLTSAVTLVEPPPSKANARRQKFAPIRFIESIVFNVDQFVGNR